MGLWALSGRWWLYAHAYGICDPLLYQSKQYIYGGRGYNAARGLISRDYEIILVTQKKVRIRELSRPKYRSR